MKPLMVGNCDKMAELASEWSFSDSVALVPTMGFLHEGHLALVREAAKHADKVIVSIFVNPLQFGPAEDFEEYPRDLDRDCGLLYEAGASLVFAPLAQDITPSNMTFTVEPGRIDSVLCGRYRPGHFAGVATIVCKLFQIVRPGQGLFGWKDAQQFLILRKMVKDLNIPIELRAVETIRETDGLAMSSRNSYLSEVERLAAPAIYRGLKSVRNAFESGETNVSKLLDEFRVVASKETGLEIQYIEAVTMDSLEPIECVQRGNTLIATAVYAGKTRLIDNIRL